MDSATTALPPGTVDVNAVDLTTTKHSTPKAAIIPCCLLPLVLAVPLTLCKAQPLLCNRTNKLDIAAHIKPLWALLTAACTKGAQLRVITPPIVVDASSTFLAQRKATLAHILPQQRPAPPPTAPPRATPDSVPSSTPHMHPLPLPARVRTIST
eukprot:4119236-Ditylum_brightwellii.AAC.1